MSMQKVEFEFPDPDSVSKEINVEPAKDVTDITEKPRSLNAHRRKKPLRRSQSSRLRSKTTHRLKTGIESLRSLPRK